MIQVPCPECGELLNLDAKFCPACRSPRHPAEVAQAIAENRWYRRLGRFLARSSTLYTVLGIATAAATGYGVQRGWISIGAMPSFDNAPAPAPAAPAPAAAPTTPAAPAKPKIDAWSVHGRAFELLTLKPVAGARVTFKDKNGGQPVECTTDAAGVYAAKLKPVAEGGYEVSAWHARYGGTFLEEGDVPFKDMSPERRREERDTLYSAKVVHVPLLLAPGQADLEYNFALISKNN
ncbi:MAG TPA: hypothetical protein VNI01_07440 [Elusimicrobiota bacterium]|nr:hypothetical protein [Elusimicrobiota bacterium]